MIEICVCRKVYKGGKLSFWFCFTTVSSVIQLVQSQRVAAVSARYELCKSVLTWNFWPTTWRWIPWLRLWWRQSFRHQSPILRLWRLQEFRCRHLQVVGTDHWVWRGKRIQYYSRLSLNGHLYKTDTSVKRTLRVGPCFLYSLYLTLNKTDTSLRRTRRAGPKSVLLKKSWLYCMPTVSVRKALCTITKKQT